MQSPVASTAGTNLPAAWGGVFALSLGAFVLVASEFMPVSLLTSIASDLHVSEGQAGQSIAVSGAFALATSLSLARLAGKLDRKILLLALTLLMIVSGSVAAFAPNYWSFMAGRAFIGVAIGGFWSMSAAIAMRLVPSEQVPKALAVVNGGNALATVVAAPLGSFLGSIVGWRGAFFALIPVAALALAWKWASLPAMPAERAPGGANVFTLLKRPAVALGMAGVSLFFMGQFALFTYLRPFLETVTHANASTTSLMLLAIPLLMAAIGLALMLFGASTFVTALLLAVWGLVGTAAPVGWWTWLAKTLPQDAEAGGGLMVAVVQLAIALGATVGGLLFDGLGYRATFSASALVLVTAAGVALLAARAARRGS